MKYADIFRVMCAAAFFAGCSTLPVENERLEKFAPDYGYRFKNIAPGENNSDELFVILTFSGGGTRAASFAYGVLEKLRDTKITWNGQERRLLDEVDLISSASGGSLPAAYYALFGDRIFEDFPDKVLYRDIQGNLIKNVLSMRNWPRLVSPFYGRSDLMGDNFSHTIFEDKTFGDLVARNRRPFIVINTTDMTTGSRIGFTQEMFDLFYSDLSAYPVGNAVAASAAFPGLLAPMTLRNYEENEDFVTPPWLAHEREAAANTEERPCFLPQDFSAYLGPNRPYVHVVDGGVADNLGLLPVIYALDGRYTSDSVRRIVENGTIKKLIIITVNAAGKPAREWDLDRGLPGLFQTLFTAGTTPMDNFTEAQMGYLRLYMRREQERQSIRRQVEEAAAANGIEISIPELQGPQPAYHFIEVTFSKIDDEAERTHLRQIRTSFGLPDEEVDRLRAAAGVILDKDPSFQELLAGLGHAPQP